MRAATWLEAWDSQGSHRTGTAGDAAGAAWLADAAAALGAAVTLERFTLERVDPVSCRVETEAGVVAGVPVFDAPPTGADGISGRVEVVRLSPWSVYTPDYQAMRRAGDRDALVIVCDGGEPGLALLNAEQFGAPYGCPAIQVAEPPRGTPRRVISHYQRTAAEAVNVVVSIAGRDSARPPIVVMTPRSSWWQSTAERGGGLVCWLETLRALLAATPARDIILTANSGHELGHLGLDEFLRRRPGWQGPDGAIWVHYGANLGAAGGTLSILANDTALRDAMRTALTERAQPPDRIAPVTQVPSGETRDIHRAGGRYVTLVGSNRLFHLPQDRWPHAVDVPSIERIAAAAADMVGTLAA